MVGKRIGKCTYGIVLTANECEVDGVKLRVTTKVWCLKVMDKVSLPTSYGMVTHLAHTHSASQVAIAKQLRDRKAAGKPCEDPYSELACHSATSAW